VTRFGLRRISDEDMKEKRYVEELIKSHKQPLRYVAMAHVVNLVSKTWTGRTPPGTSSTTPLLGELRGDSGEFDAFVKRAAEVRARSRAHARGESPAGDDTVGEQLTSLRAGAADFIRDANVRMNEMIQATAAGRAGLKAMMP